MTAAGGGGTDTSRNLGPGPADRLAAEKVEAIGIEYSYLLTSQLDTQRAYYEDQSAELEGQLMEAHAQVASLNIALKETMRDSEDQLKEEQEKIANIQKAYARVEARADKMGELARKFEKELKEERAVGKGLLENVSSLKVVADRADGERKALEERLRECEDQLRDVMFFLEARDKIADGAGVEGEASGGTVELPPPAPPKQPQKKKKKPKK